MRDGTSYRQYQANGRPMLFPHLTPQQLTIDGSWQGDEVVNPGLFPFPQGRWRVRALEVDEAVGVDHSFS
jgi:hypothetical protein